MIAQRENPLRPIQRLRKVSGKFFRPALFFNLNEFMTPTNPSAARATAHSIADNIEIINMAKAIVDDSTFEPEARPNQAASGLWSSPLGLNLNNSYTYTAQGTATR